MKKVDSLADIVAKKLQNKKLDIETIEMTDSAVGSQKSGRMTLAQEKAKKEAVKQAKKTT